MSKQLKTAKTSLIQVFINYKDFTLFQFLFKRS